MKKLNPCCASSAPSFKVSPQEMVQEIHQVLMDREDTCHRTCFSLQLDGNVLDNFAELKTIEGLQEGSVLKVIEGKSFRSDTSFACSRCLVSLGRTGNDLGELLPLNIDN